MIQGLGRALYQTHRLERALERALGQTHRLERNLLYINITYNIELHYSYR